MSKKEHKTEPDVSAPPGDLIVAEGVPLDPVPPDPFVSAAAAEMPDKAKVFAVTDRDGDNSCDITAIDEPDAIATWCVATGTPAEKRKVTVALKPPDRV